MIFSELHTFLSLSKQPISFNDFESFSSVRRRWGKGSSISIEKHPVRLAHNSQLTYIARLHSTPNRMFFNTWRNNFWYVPASWSTDYVYNAVFRPHFDQRITNRLYFRPIRDTERAQRVAHQNSARTTCYLLALLSRGDYYRCGYGGLTLCWANQWHKKVW